jgi:type III restriction enzyme
LGSQSSTPGLLATFSEDQILPDFVAELTDGRILVVEHKGKVYATNDDSKEKCNVGLFGKKRATARRCF